MPNLDAQFCRPMAQVCSFSVLRGPWLCAVLALAPAACSHAVPRALAAPDVAALPATQPPAGADLSEVDLRLVAEAIAYDVTHAPWHRAQQERLQTTPAVFVEEIAATVAGAGGKLDGPGFVLALAQALRNTGAMDVLDAAAADAPGALALQVRVRSHDDELEGQWARVFAVSARVHPPGAGADVWEKLYPLRKRLGPVMPHAGP